MRLVLDTGVVVAAMRSPTGGSAELLRLIRLGRVPMQLTVALALEYESQCLLAEHRLASGLSELEAHAFVDRLISLAETIELYFRWRPQLHDPGDELVLLVIAAAEKISAMETERFFAERRARRRRSISPHFESQRWRAAAPGRLDRLNSSSKGSCRTEMDHYDFAPQSAAERILENAKRHVPSNRLRFLPGYPIRSIRQGFHE
ncbi:MAG: PIN domain-containing protein [Terracidiphilus sp.]